MAIDGIFCARLAKELAKIEGARIEKVVQTGDEEAVLRIYAGGEKKSLLLSASRQNARVCLCDDEAPARDAPPTPFFLLLRKRVQNARITAVFAPENERIICIDAEGKDELSYPSRSRIHAELMGKYGNLLLTDTESGKVLGALYQSDMSTARRAVFPGLPYEPPPKQDKEAPNAVTRERFLRLCAENAGRDCADFILKTFASFSPLTAREVAHRALALDKTVGEADAERLWEAFRGVLDGETKPCLVTDGSGKAIAFSHTRLTQYGAPFVVTEADSLSALLKSYYDGKSAREKHDRRSSDLKKLLATLHARAERKKGLQLQSLKDCEKKDGFRRLGDLIIGNIHLLKQGMERALLKDCETGEEREVELDRRLSPSANARACYKKYKKLKNTEIAAAQQLQRTEKELLYLESVADAVARAESDAEFDDIRSELAKSGYIRSRSKEKGKGAKERKQLSKPFRYTADGGFEVRVGRNNMQNDALTFSAAKGDLWFHVKNAPGSHAVLCAGGEEPSALAYTQAAMVAAYHSSKRGESGVAVDYARVRFVKKPPGAAPGFVTYTHFHTAYVDARLPEF